MEITKISYNRWYLKYKKDVWYIEKTPYKEIPIFYGNLITKKYRRNYGKAIIGKEKT